MTRHAVLVALSVATGGCLSYEPAPALPSVEGGVERARWERAPAGCEDVDPRGLVLASVEGEEDLGALVARDGEVQCVDSLAMLLVEWRSPLGGDPAAGDPSPQPTRPPNPEEGRPISGRASLGPPPERAAHGDPTPTPAVGERPDPTPTPAMER